MKIELHKPMVKAFDESERVLQPSQTVENALEAVRKAGIDLSLELKDFDSVFWVSRLSWKSVGPERKPEPKIRMGGKGPSPEQCRASGCMEFIERWTVHTGNIFDKSRHMCLDLRENREYSLKPSLEMQNTKCIAAGNNYEEAILHCLHELIETRTPLSGFWNSCRVVDMQDMFPELPQWVRDTILLIQSPAERKEFYKFTAVQYPYNGEFDDYQPFSVRKKQDSLSFIPNVKNPKKHSPNSGGAAGLNPKKTAFRAMNEVFQFQNEIEDFKKGRKKDVPDLVATVGLEVLPNYETDSITDDIRLILDLLGEDVFVGAVDLTDPEIGIPVVKVISDYDPNYSFVSRKELGAFFDF